MKVTRWEDFLEDFLSRSERVSRKSRSDGRMRVFSAFCSSWKADCAVGTKDCSQLWDWTGANLQK